MIPYYINMKYCWVLSILVGFILISTQSMECPKTSATVADLMNFDHSYDFPCMYSGLIDVNKTSDSNIFYWLFMSPQQSASTHLVLWFTGGPGEAGENSIFQENGPLRFKVGDNDTYKIISDMKSSIVDVVNVVYIDQPLGVGYSYSHENVTQGKQIGDYMTKFLTKFYDIYPQLQKQELIVAGNSYGGHFVAPVVRAFLNYNSNTQSRELKIPLSSVMVEDGIVSPIHQRLSIKDIAFASGLITADLLPEYEILEQKCESAMQISPQTAFKKCKQMISFMSDTNGGWSLKDIRYESGKEPLRNEELLDTYFGSETVQSQLHVLNDGKTIPFTNFNGTVYSRLKLEGAVDYAGTYNDIVNEGIPLMVISASLDGQDGITGTDRWVMSLDVPKHKDNKHLIKSLYFYKDDALKLGGSYTVFKNSNKTISLVHVYSAGHILGSTQIHVSKQLFKDLSEFKEAKCHRDQGCEIKDKKGTCEEGKCKCNQGTAYGADCSIVPKGLENTSFTLYPREWKYFKADRNQAIVINLNTKEDMEIHVYHSVGAAPTRMNHDGFKKASKMSYSLDAVSKYTVIAVHNPSLTDDVSVQIKYESVNVPSAVIKSE